MALEDQNRICDLCGAHNPPQARVCQKCKMELATASVLEARTDPQLARPSLSFDGLSAGDVIAGQYEVVRPIGEGGMGRVYLVRDLDSGGVEEALKLIRPELLAHPEADRRFTREFLAARSLNHRNIVRVFHIGRDKGVRFFTMEYVAGPSLRSLLDAQKAAGKSLSLQLAGGLLLQVLEALAAAHAEGVIHRDLKPENMMVSRTANGWQAKVMDFGLAKVMSASQFSLLAQGLGTAGYMPPEQYNGSEAEPASDVYSAGAILYEMFTHKLPGGRFPLPGELRRELPKSLDQVLDKALQMEPADRYQTAADMAAELKAVLAGRSAKPSRISVVEEHKEEKEPENEPSEVPGQQEQEKLEKLAVARPGMSRAEAGACQKAAAKLAGMPLQFTNSLGMEFVLIPPGDFMMGSPKDEPRRLSDEIHHLVTISKSFYMQSTPVTQGQWRALMGDNPSHFKDCGDCCPVEMVSWNDAQEFIAKLNREEGADKYRLPTEAEWEFSCRAGTTTPFNTGENITTDQANYDGNCPMPGFPRGNYRDRTIPVGSFASNAWGLFDMHGNVWEWVQDWYEKYASGSVTDPRGPSSGSGRVNRGGGWLNIAGYCRSADRGRSDPGVTGSNLGFRLASGN